MRSVELFEAKQKLSKLVERALEGEKIGITRRAAPEATLRDIFRDIEKIRKRAKPGRGVNVRDLIEEGRT
jgi:prevent-host-death family protein